MAKGAASKTWSIYNKMNKLTILHRYGFRVTKAVSWIIKYLGKAVKMEKKASGIVSKAWC